MIILNFTKKFYNINNTIILTIILITKWATVQPHLNKLCIPTNLLDLIKYNLLNLNLLYLHCHLQYYNIVMS